MYMPETQETVQFTLRAEGDTILMEIPGNTLVQNLAQFARTLQGTAALRVNGKVPTEGQTIKAGDKVAAIPAGGQLA
jgi:hypothetical protein